MKLFNHTFLRKLTQSFFQVILSLGLLLTLWNTFSLVLNTPNPIYITATSASLNYHRGDILILSHWNQQPTPGDTFLYMQQDKQVPNLHRVLISQKQYDDYYLLTKVDLEKSDGRGVYPKGRLWLHKRDVIGKVRIVLPAVGRVVLWMESFPMFKFAVLGVVGVLVMIAKDPA